MPVTMLDNIDMGSPQGEVLTDFYNIFLVSAEKVEGPRC